MNISNECLQMNIVVIAKNANITYIFDHRNSFNNLIHSSPSSIFESPLSDKPPLIRFGETYKLTTGRSILEIQHKVLC